MEYSKLIHLFDEFANKRLSNHLLELDTRYQNRSLDPGELRSAYDKHRQIFQEELDNKIQELIKDENSWLGGQLTTVKDDYLKKLAYPK